MARQTFTWLPLFDSEQSLEPDVGVVRFGEGYELRQANGLNSQKPEWNLVFEDVPTKIAQIEAFLKARGAVESFNWKNPDNQAETLVVVCSKWSKTRHQGYHSLQCVFRRVFEQ